MSIKFFEWEGSGGMGIPALRSHIDIYGQGWINGVSVPVDNVSFDEPLPPSCIKLLNSLVENHCKNPKNCTMQPNRRYDEGYTIDKSFFIGLAEIQNVAKEIKSLKQAKHGCYSLRPRNVCSHGFISGYCDEPNCSYHMLSEVDNLKLEIKKLKETYEKKNTELESELAYYKNLPPALMESLGYTKAKN
jgi:hypothetical protein